MNAPNPDLRGTGSKATTDDTEGSLVTVRLYTIDEGKEQDCCLIDKQDRQLAL